MLLKMVIMYNSTDTSVAPENQQIATVVNETSASTTLLDQVIDSFFDAIMPSGSTPTLTSVLSNCDKKFDECQLSIDMQQVPTVTPGSEMLKEIEHLKQENDIMKLHINTQLQKLQEENRMLKEKVFELENSLKIQPPSAPPPSVLPPTPNMSEAIIKAFNSIPKKVKDFYLQMEKGDNVLPKFSDIPDGFKKNKRTKGTYSKRQTIYHHIKNHHLGINEVLASSESLSSLQLYEQIKKSRLMQ